MFKISVLFEKSVYFNWEASVPTHPLSHNLILFCLLIKSICKPQNTKNAKYTKTPPNTVLATAFPSSGSFIEPINDSLFVLNKYPITDNITIANDDSMKQQYAWNVDTTGFMIEKDGCVKCD